MEANPIRITLPDSHTPMSSSLEKEYYLTSYNIISVIKKMLKK